MKILYIHNEYARPSGEEHAAAELEALLAEHGHIVNRFRRSSAEIAGSRAGMVKSFFTGINNPAAARQLDRKIREFRPDAAIVQNLYPLLSPAIFRPLRRHGVHVAMRCPNYRLFCPTGLALDPQGRVCERCFPSAISSLNCVRFNCEHSMMKSAGYAMRNMAARLSRRIVNGVDKFIVQSEFQRDVFMRQGIPGKKIVVVPGISPHLDLDEKRSPGEFVSFVGRVSAEKGIYDFIEAAKMNPEIPFRVAGNLDSAFKMPDPLPDNLQFVGFLKGRDLDEFYLDSRIVVVPSKWYEGFPNVIVRGMLHERPVITSSIGAMKSIIDPGVNGELVPPGDARALGETIGKLWHDKARCAAYGTAGRVKAESEYSRESVYTALQEALS